MSSRSLRALCLALAACVLAPQALGQSETLSRQITIRTSTFNNGLGFGARAMGMAGAFTAIADDASAASWNPAGLGQLIRPELTIVGGYNKVEVETRNESNTFFAPPATTPSIFTRSVDRTSEATSYGADFLSLAIPFKLGRQLVTTQISYARNARPLNGTESIKIDFFDRPGGTDLAPDFSDSKASSSGGYDSFGLGFGTGFDERLYIGFTVNYWTGTTSTSTETRFRSLINGTVPGTQVLFADYTTEIFEEQRYSGLSASVGILVKPSSKLSIGLTYRGGWTGSDVYESHFDQAGKYTFNVTGGTPSSQLLPFRASGTQISNGNLTWPGTLGGGIAFRPIEALTIAIDGSLTDWGRSSTSRVPVAQYDGNCTIANGAATCPIKFTEQNLQFPSQTQNSFIEQNNQTALRLGLEYVIRPGSVSIPIRAGAYRIKTIAPLYADARYVRTDQDPEVYFSGITAGIGLAIPVGAGSLLFDAAGVFDKASTSQNSDVADQNGKLVNRLTGDKEVKNSRLIGSIIYRF